MRLRRKKINMRSRRSRFRRDPNDQVLINLWKSFVEVRKRWPCGSSPHPYWSGGKREIVYRTIANSERDEAFDPSDLEAVLVLADALEEGNEARIALAHDIHRFVSRIDSQDGQFKTRTDIDMFESLVKQFWELVGIVRRDGSSTLASRDIHARPRRAP